MDTGKEEVRRVLFQTLILPSADPLKRIPFLAVVRAFTASSWALMDSKQLKSDNLHTLTVLSHDPGYKISSSS
jgi:hypothetical protein